MGYRPDIDGLRAVAVLSVLLYHLGVGAFSGGFVGVDVFFVISGYLITRIIWRDIERGRFSITFFYERRARRILPALFPVIAFACVVGLFLFTPEELERFARSALGSVLFFQNFVLWQEAGYFDAASETKPLLHIWSLAVEEQFYIFFPLGLVAVAKFLRKSRAVHLVLVAAVLSLAVCIYLTPRSPVFSFFMFPVRAWELLIGSALAMGAFPGPRRAATVASHIVSVLGLALIVSAVVTFSQETPFPGWTALLPTVGAAALIWSGPVTAVGRVLAFPPIRFLGLISYSLYLWHWPLIAFHALVFPGPAPFWHALVLLLASVLLGWLSWRFVEAPFRRPGGVFPTRGRVLAASGVAIAVFAIAALVAPLFSQSPWRVPPDALAAANTSREKEISDSWCRPEIVLTSLRGQDRGFCGIGVETVGFADVLILGDSHVGAWYPAMDAILKDEGIAANAISMAGCPIAYDLARTDTGKEGCVEAMSAVRDHIEAHDVRKVVIVASFFGVLSNKNTIYEGRRSTDAASRMGNATRAIAETGEDLRRAGVRTAFLLTVPGSRFPVPEAIFREKMLGFYPEARRTVEEYDALMGPIAETASAHYDVLLRVDDFLCRDLFCDIVLDGQPLYYDSNHPTLLLNARAQAHLAAQLQGFLSSGTVREVEAN